MREMRRVLFIRTDRLGDVLMNLPAIRVLRQSFPKSWLAVGVDSSVADLLKGHPDIDEVMAVDGKALEASAKARWKLIADIRKARFDLAVVSNPNKFLHLAVFLGGIGIRVGYRRKWGFLLNRTLRDRKDEAAKPEIDMNLDLVRLAAEKNWDGGLVIPADERAVKDVGERLGRECPGDSAIIAAHVGTSNPDKRWAAEKFAELCDKIQANEFLKVILIGGAEEAVHSERVASGMRTPVTDWTGRLSLKELTAFLKHPRVKTLVSSDSGPVHIAWMSGKPVVALYAKNQRGSNPMRWGPRDGKSQVIYKPMAEISSDEVYGRIVYLLRARHAS